MKKLLLITFLAVSNCAFSQQSIFTTIVGGDLYSLDLTNCSKTLVGATGIGFGDLAFTDDGKLWGIAGGELFAINTNDASVVSVGLTGLDAVSLVGWNDTMLIADAGKKLYQINTRTAEAMYIDTIGYQSAGDLTWHDDDLYMVTTEGQIVKIVLNDAFTRIQSVTPIGNSIPTCEGAVTTTFANEYNAIVGFNGRNAIKICAIDGSYSMLCADLLPDGVPGAASTKIPSQVPQPTQCERPTSVLVDGNHPEFQLYPNPANAVLHINTNSTASYTLIVYNAIGQIITTVNNIQNNYTLPVSDLTNGWYTLTLKNDQGSSIHRFNVLK